MAQRGRPSRQSILADLDRAKASLAEVGGLPKPEEGGEIWDGIWHEETHHSTAMEGNTMALSQVKVLLEEGRAIGNKDLQEYLEIQAYSEAAQWVYAHAVRVDDNWKAPDQIINLTELRQIHQRVTEPVWRHFPPDHYSSEEGPGSFRRHNIEPLASRYTPPPWTDVPALVADWIEFANAKRNGVHLVYHLAEAHAQLERVHPFRDGNGRTGRLALNLMLVRHGYPPAIIYKRDRSRYLAALRRADQGDAAALAELVARAVKHSIDRFVLPGLAGPHRLVSLSALADKDVSLVALRQAAERGRLRAIMREGQWESTKKWVADYKKSRHRGRGPRAVAVRTAPVRVK